MSLEHKRHTLAHLLAAAVKKLYPDAILTLGPAVDNGFYYDIKFSKEPSEKDLKKIEKQMKKLINSWDTMRGEVVSEQKAREIFKDNKYKLELIDEIVAKGEEITLYTAGDFTDLCRGGHCAHPKDDLDMKAFTLAKIAGAYWRGDENNDMLTRIYGYAFDTPQELQAYKQQLLEAKKRDHRKLGKELDLFTFSPLVGAGLPLWTPRGTLLRELIIEKIQSLQSQYGYERVTIPHITKKDLYETSGHWEKFGDELFHVHGQNDQAFVLKPMNCPHHTQIFASRPRSYKDLPLRYMETTMVYRDEQAGELLGLSRVRSISQDDGHVFCAKEDIASEITNLIAVIRSFYSALDMFNDGDYWVSISVRDKSTPQKYLGEEATWDEAEKILEDVAKKEHLTHTVVPGDAAFYGPKLDFIFKDALGREWQLATIQLDFVMPQRFNLVYTDAQNEKQTPVMIHRAIAGSLERFLSVLIEHFAGAFPLWLSPVQVVIIPVSDKFNAYGEDVMQKLQAQNVRVEIDTDSETLGKRIRSAEKMKIPYMLIVGEKEVNDNTLAVRSYANGDLGTQTIDAFLEKITTEQTSHRA